MWFAFCTGGWRGDANEHTHGAGAGTGGVGGGFGGFVGCGGGGGTGGGRLVTSREPEVGVAQRAGSDEARDGVWRARGKASMNWGRLLFTAMVLAGRDMYRSRVFTAFRDP